MSSRIVRTTVAAVACALAGTTALQAGALRYTDAAQYSPVQLAPSALRYISMLTCVVSGTPVAFPNDVFITNWGADLPAGKWIYWQINGSGIGGYYQLTAPLPAGASVFAANVIPGGWPAGAACTATPV